MRRPYPVFWYLGFGLLPLWGALALLLLGSVSRPADYWTAAPWLLLLALPLCGITLAMAGAIHAVHARTEGSASRKLGRAGRALAVMMAIVLAAGALLWLRHERNGIDMEALRQEGQGLVRRSALVARLAPPGFQVSPTVTAYDRRHALTGFIYYVHSGYDRASALVAIVDVSHDRTPTLRLRCVIGGRDYDQLQSGSDPCASPHATVAR